MIPLHERWQQVHQRFPRARFVDVRDIWPPGEYSADAVPLLVVEKVGLGILVESPEVLEDALVVQRDHLDLFRLRHDANGPVILPVAIEVVQEVEIIEVPDAELSQCVQLLWCDDTVDEELRIKIMVEADLRGPVGLPVLHQIISVAAVAAAVWVEW